MNGKNNLSILILLTAFCINGYSQAPAWLWAQRAGGTAQESGESITTDPSGNIYVTGIFSGPTITFGSTVLTSAGGGQDIFIVKYDELGNVIWAKSAGGPNIDYSFSITTDPSSNIYVTGSFHLSTITFGSITLTTAGAQDIFIAKYDSAGNVLWAKRAGGTNFDEGYNITTDTSGSVYVAGQFSSSSITFGTTTLTNSGSSTDIFLAKYDSSGNVIWAKSAGGIYQDKVSGIKTDLAGNIYLSGFFSSISINFGSIMMSNADVSGSTYDMFVAKYDSSGNVLWARREGSIADDGAHAIAIDANANIFLTGWFSSPSVTFGSTTLILGSTWGDIFIAKYDSSGNSLWARRAGGTYNQVAFGASTDMSGNVYIAGAFQSDSCSFGSILLTNASNTGDEDIFVAKYDGTGNVLWAISAGGPPQDVPWDICTNALGNAYITGYFWSPTLSFGSNTLVNAGPPNSGDVFVAKLDYVTGISEQNNYRDVLKVFPNPTSDKLLVTGFSGKAEIVIYSCIGEKVLETTIIKNEIDVGDLISGIYFLKVKCDGEERVAMFVRQ